jgi:hypothetical protein
MSWRIDRTLHSPEFKKKILRRRRIKIAIWTTILIIFIALPIYLSRINHFLISEIVVEGNAATSDDEIKAIARDLISGNYLWLIPKRNALIYPRGTIKEILHRKIPRLTMIDLNIDSANTLVITVDERAPDSLYCEDISTLSNPTNCFFLDESGYIFSKAPLFSGDVYFIYATEVPIPEPLTKNILTPEEFSKLDMFIKDLPFLDPNPRALVIDDEEYNLVLPSGGKIIWKRGDDLALIRSNLEAFILDPATKRDKTFLDRVQYLDLRFENKVFYKLRE